LILLLLPTYLQADNSPLVIGGSQHAKDSDYSYLGVIQPLPGEKLGEGWFWQAIGSWLSYEYDLTVNGQPDELKANAPGIESGMGYAWSSGPWRASLSLSLGYRHYRLSPDVAGEEPEGSTLSLTPKLQLSYLVSEQFELSMLNNWSLGPQSVFNRFRAGYRPHWRWQVGPELYYQEGKNYRIKQAGLFVSRIMEGGVSLELNAGISESQDQSGDPYLGLALSKLF
ncbi:MAG: cellulose biosynthesis protein BcsS, partial [Methylophaga sp.]|nr:cellulose biosynthesis protein BcsS [Methylophaga sp.]